MSKRPLCVSPLCRSRGYHWDDCEGGPCQGCQPRLAADQSRLCTSHLRRLGRDIAQLPELHEALAESMAGGSGADKVATKPGSRVPNPAAMQHRTEIRAVLVPWALMVAEERELTTPDDNIQAICEFLHLHHEWLAASDAADDCITEIGELAGVARSIAYPSGKPRTRLGGCVKPGCEGVLWARFREAASAVTCDADESHLWEATQWRRLSQQLKAAA
jgi:hypothetical protein